MGIPEIERVKMKEHNFKIDKSYEKSIKSSGITNLDNADIINDFKIDYSKVDYSEIKNDGYVTQGYTQMGDKIIITAHAEGDKDYARMYIYDLKTGEFLGKANLKEKCHAGGISYDPVNNVIYVSGNEHNNGKSDIMVYDAKKLDNCINNGDFNFDEAYIGNVSIDGEAMAATLYSYDGKLYTGEFDGTSSSKVCEITIDYDTDNNIKNYNYIQFDHDYPDLVQGMVITEYNDKKYFIFSRSLKNTDSSISVYYLGDDNKLHYDGQKYYDQEGMEGMVIDDTNTLSFVFEYGDSKIETLKLEDLIGNYDSVQLHTSVGRAIGGFIYNITH